MKIRLGHDNYEGWICHKQYFQIDKAQYLVCLKIQYYNYNLIDALTTDLGDIIPIGLGVLAFMTNHCLINGTRFQFEVLIKTKINKTDVVNIAYMYLHAP